MSFSTLTGRQSFFSVKQHGVCQKIAQQLAVRVKTAKQLAVRSEVTKQPAVRVEITKQLAVRMKVCTTTGCSSEKNKTPGCFLKIYKIDQNVKNVKLRNMSSLPKQPKGRPSYWPGEIVKQYCFKSSKSLDFKLKTKLVELKNQGYDTQRSQLLRIIVENSLDQVADLYRKHY